MSRPVTISISNYYILAMPGAFLLMDEINFSMSEPDLKFFEQRISGQSMKMLLRKPYNISETTLYTALASPDRGADKILRWLAREGQTFDPDRYIFFLETMMDYALVCWEGSPSKEKGFGMLGVLETMITVYTENIKPSIFRRQKGHHTNVWSNIDDTLRNQVQLLAKGYVRYIDECQDPKISKRKFCKSIEQRKEYRSAGLVGIRDIFREYDDYFEAIEGPIPLPKSFPEEFPGKIGLYQFINPKIEIDRRTRAQLITLCAKIVNGYPESKSWFDL